MQDCPLNYLLSQGTTKLQCDTNYLRRWHCPKSVLKLPKQKRQYDEQPHEIDVNENRLTQSDIDSYISEGYKLNVSYTLNPETEVQKRQRSWTWYNTKQMFRKMITAKEPLLIINVAAPFKISCQNKGCRNCQEWYKDQNWQDYENRLLRWAQI